MLSSNKLRRARWGKDPDISQQPRNVAASCKPRSAGHFYSCARSWTEHRTRGGHSRVPSSAYLKMVQRTGDTLSPWVYPLWSTRHGQDISLPCSCWAFFASCLHHESKRAWLVRGVLVTAFNCPSDALYLVARGCRCCGTYPQEVEKYFIETILRMILRQSI